MMNILFLLFGIFSDRKPFSDCFRGLVDKAFQQWQVEIRVAVLGFLSRGSAAITQEYRDNRVRFPRAEPLKYQGAWVAFSADSRRILAHGETVEAMEQQIAAEGENSQNVVLEWLPGPEEDSLLGAGEWM